MNELSQCLHENSNFDCECTANKCGPKPLLPSLGGRVPEPPSPPPPPAPPPSAHGEGDTSWSFNSAVLTGSPATSSKPVRARAELACVVSLSQTLSLSRSPDFVPALAPLVSEKLAPTDLLRPKNPPPPSPSLFSRSLSCLSAESDNCGWAKRESDRASTPKARSGANGTPSRRSRSRMPAIELLVRAGPLRIPPVRMPLPLLRRPDEVPPPAPEYFVTLAALAESWVCRNGWDE